MTRIWLTIGVLAFCAVLAALMYLGYRNRAKRQAKVLPEFPAVPTKYADPDTVEPILPRADGVYVSTVTTKSWQDRVAVGDIGFRANASLYLLDEGVLVERAGSRTLWIPRESIVDVSTERGLAGKVMGTDSLLVIRWRAGDTEFDTGFLGHESVDYPQWIEALRPADKQNTGESQ